MAPSELRNLTNLVELTLFDNKLGGEILNSVFNGSLAIAQAASQRQGKSFFNHEPTQQSWLIYCTMFLWFQLSAIKDTFGDAKKASLGSKRVEQVKVTT